MSRPILLALAVALSGTALAQQGDGTDVAATVHTFKPAKVEADARRISTLEVPQGFSIRPFATGLLNVRAIAVAPDGAVYATRRDQGDVILLRDADGDGRADGPARQVAHRPGAHGLAIHEGKLYLATVREVFVAPIAADGGLGELTMLIGDLPDGGQHPNRTLAFGPDGMLYISIGSTCNACNETNPESATLLRVSPDGRSRTIFASGLRNTIGFDWEPATGELWGMDHGIDQLGDDIQPEELNLLRKGKRYGWPHVFAEGGINPQSTPPGGISKEQWRQMSVPMTLGYTAHAAPMQMLFYRGANFPEQYRGSAFVTMRGSWNRKPASGYELVRIPFRNGRPGPAESFVTGFLSDGGTTHFARPMGLAMAADGALLMGDDANGVIYRIAHGQTQANDGQAAAPPPARAMLAQSSAGIGVPIAMKRPETAAAREMSLESASLSPGQPIPLRHSEYADGVSPALRWSAVPGALSYALVMEDPDAKPITPFVHWVAWNIPGGLDSLPEGLQEQMRLTEPPGLLQGATSRGSVGYFGPRPPPGDPPHRYHFQIFALDRMLDVAPGSDRDAVLAAMKGHVLAKGMLTGTFQQRDKPPR
ncbi:MAG: YbhB/YbcL family Raf kinase inhibitor-like protein [Lysobacteraceae bacterium]|nr:MAG: YbhB/YbcL family Raf kinase inhibitor-like protein [Xanthomonadaceae bacterium]